MVHHTFLRSFATSTTKDREIDTSLYGELDTTTYTKYVEWGMRIITSIVNTEGLLCAYDLKNLGKWGEWG